MADTIDDAQAVNELHQELSLRAFRLRVRTPPLEFDGTNCTDCGEAVEPPRLALGFWRCIDCATRLEQQQRLKTK